MKSYELQYVTLEQAKALSEIGFPQDYDNFQTYTNLDGGIWVKPQLEQVTKWFREEKGIHIYAECVSSYNWYVCGINGSLITTPKYNFLLKREIQYPQNYTTYEEALSDGITKAIKQYNNESI